MNPLDNTYLKMERAKEHLDALKAEVSAFLESNPHTITPHPKPDQGWDTPSVKFTSPPVRLGLLIGDAVHNMRSALDALAWQLSLRPVGTADDPGSDPEFPIFKVKPTRPREVDSYDRRVRYLPGPAKDNIEALQPYHRGQAAEKHILWVLHYLDVIDKHRIVPVIGNAGVIYPYGVRGPFYLKVMGRILEGGNVNPLFRIVGGNQERFNPSFSVELVFDMPGPAYNTGVLKLYRIHDFIGKEVIPKFTQFFS